MIPDTEWKFFAGTEQRIKHLARHQEENALSLLRGDPPPWDPSELAERQIGILQAMARYDHPASKVVVMRALPWIVTNQNEDGSWGDEPRKDVSTLCVLEALFSLGDLLPAGIVLQ